MNSLYDQFHSCIRHPHCRIVGVCSSCLQERLSSLIEPASPSPLPGLDARNAHAQEQACRAATINKHTASIPREQAQEPNAKPYRDPARPSLPSDVRDAIAGMVPRSSRQETHLLEKGKNYAHSSSACTATAAPSHDGQNANMRRPKLVEHHCASDSASGTGKFYQTGQMKKQEGSPLAPSSISTSLEKKFSTIPVKNKQQTDVSFSDRDKEASGFSLSKSKSPLQQAAQLDVDCADAPKYASKSPQSEDGTSIARSLDCWQQVQRPDLEAIAEITTAGDASSMIQSHISRESGMPNSSWLSVFFHRKKWSRSRSNLSNSSSSSINNATADANGKGPKTNETLSQGQDCGVEAVRLSWDGGRPNLKQLLKKMETRGGKPSEASPAQQTVKQQQQQQESGRHAAEQARNLQKSKSIASSRSSISVEMAKDVIQSSFSPTLHQGKSNVMVGLDYESSSYYDDQNLLRSRSWGRTWNRALSPLWGSRSRRHKVALDASASAHECNYLRTAGTAVAASSPSAKNSDRPSPSVHLSPLRSRGKLLSTLRKLL